MPVARQFILRPVFLTHLALLLAGVCHPGVAQEAKPSLQIATFQCDVTPPAGSPLCFGFVRPAEKVVDPLSARGLILITDEDPVVLCTVDWVAIANGAHDAWREALADAVGTTVDRVSVHVLHNHDAPGVDFSAAEILAVYGHRGTLFDDGSARQAIKRAATAASEAMRSPGNVSHIGFGKGKVEKFASNRRVVGPGGKLKYWRGSSTGNADARAEPEGAIDPYVRLVSFWDQETPLVSLTYYASHPQSYYGRGGVSVDTVGLARSAREEALPQIAHIHFNGAAGNVAAGKYNDGATENRKILADRLAAGMRHAWQTMKKVPLRSGDVSWHTRPVRLPRKKSLDTAELTEVLGNPNSRVNDRVRACRALAWLKRCEAGHTITIGCLHIGPARILHMPGELFVEYQLAAQKMRPDLHVCLAAYGDHGPGYIGTTVAYSQGGYEVGPPSNTAPEVEAVLMSAMRQLLKAKTPAAINASAPPFYHDKLNLMHYLDGKGKAQPVRSMEDWQQRRRHILRNFELVAGQLPGSEQKVPLDMRVEEVEQLENYVRKKITYASAANDRVPAYLLIPNDVQGRVPAVLCLHQTTKIGKREPAGLGGSADLHYAAELSERGYVTLAPDYPFFGENQHDPYKNGYVSCIMKGIWNHMRAVDLLQSLPEVDGQWIGVIGHSLGGHNSLFLGMYDERVRCVATCCGYTTNQAFFDKHGRIPGTASNRYYPRMNQLTDGVLERTPFDMAEIAAATAPRPLLTVAPLRDGNFPVEGVKDCRLALTTLYELHKANDRLSFDFPDAGHTFPAESRERAYTWLDRWLKR